MGQLCCILIWRNLTNNSKENTILKTKLPNNKENEGTPPNPQIQDQHDTSRIHEQHTPFKEKPQQQQATQIPNKQWNQPMWCASELVPVYDTASVPPKPIKRRVVASEKSGRLISGGDSWAPPIATRQFESVDLPLQKTPRQQMLCENGPPKPPRQLVSSPEESSRQHICDVSTATPISASRYNRSGMELQQPSKRNTVYAKGPPKPPRLFTYDAETPPRQQIRDSSPKPPIPPRQHDVSVPTIPYVYVPPVPPRGFTRSSVALQTTAGHLPQDISSLMLYRPKGELVPIWEDRELNIPTVS